MKSLSTRSCAALLILLLLPAWVWAVELVDATTFSGKKGIEVTFTTPVDKQMAGEVARYTVYEESDPDIKLKPTSIMVGQDGRSVTLTFAESLNTTRTHVVSVRGLAAGTDVGFKVAKSYFGYLFSIMIAALLINNYVFTKYLGLCVFFGTSKRKETAKGMGVVFTIVMLVSASMSWFFYKFILIPFNLGFLQIVVFIGLVSLTVQAVDTILRKVNPILFNSFGVYLVLVIANCIIIAVPLVMSSLNYNFLETFMLALGAGGGFLLALYLMSSVRERLEIARIPPTFKGLPIAFIVAGQFAMAFLGFSGLQLF
jgi:electron transport complex protein RnfA